MSVASFFAVPWVASRPALVLPGTPEVKIHLGSRNAKDTTKKKLAEQGRFTALSELVARKPQVGSRGTQMMALVISFCAAPHLKAHQVNMSLALSSSMPPPRLGLSTQRALGIYVPLLSHVRGATSMAMPWGSSRGFHPQFDVRHLTCSQGYQPLMTLLRLSKVSTPKSGPKPIPMSLRHKGQMLLSDK